MNVLVTGSASGFAQILLARLAATPGLALLLGVDLRESAFTHERYVQVVIDPRSAQLARVMQGAQTVIHLAPAASDAAAAQGAMLEIAQNLYACALSAGVRQVIQLSSALVYDAQTGTAINEQRAYGAASGCAAVEALRAMEAWLDGFETENPALRIVRLRPHWLLGPHCDSVLARLLRQRFSLRQSAASRLQCVHEDDVVDAIALALQTKQRGVFNLACKEAVTLAEMHRQTRWLRLPVTAPWLASRLDTDTGCIEMLAQSMLLSSKRARTELGWKPRYDRMGELLRNA